MRIANKFEPRLHSRVMERETSVIDPTKVPSPSCWLVIRRAFSKNAGLIYDNNQIVTLPPHFAPHARWAVIRDAKHGPHPLLSLSSFPQPRTLDNQHQSFLNTFVRSFFFLVCV